MDGTPYDLFVTVRGRVQGTFNGGVTAKGYAGAIEALAFTYEASTPTAAGSGQAAGRVQHSPVTIVKEWDTASTQLFKALTNNEALDTVVLTFVPATSRVGKVSGSGAPHTITLSQALVSKIALHRDSPAPGTSGVSHDLEEISFVFQKIELGDLQGGPVVASGAGSSQAATAGYSEAGCQRAGAGAGDARPAAAAARGVRTTSGQDLPGQLRRAGAGPISRG